MEKEKEEAIGMERNWVDLPPEIFPLILEKLLDISDFVRSRAVCKPWLLSSSVSDLPPQFPWILRFSKGSDLEFYSIALNKVYTIRAPISFGYRFFGPAGGYILTGRRGYSNTFSFLNPLNNCEVPLPDLHDIDPYCFSDNFSWFGPPSFQIDDYALFTQYERSVLCKLREDWRDVLRTGPLIHYRCCYLKGLLFSVEGPTGVTKIMDISSHRELYVVPPPKAEEMSNMSFECPYLVESCEEILAVCYHPSYKRDYTFYIHRLEIGNTKEKPCWVKLSSIGDRILFFDFPHGTGCGLCLRASDFPGFKANCIYFIDTVHGFHLSHAHVINVYDIENGETMFIDTPFDRDERITWFMPTLNHI